ncbi:SDR family oxidoreductase [Emcibacteraceae bacterium]|uniref:SDR family NAD(P)-dependent oxidoreductase n=1 Tax=Pseudemcibacter sp. TaxID=2943293 RepID=UPI002318D5AE|nr:SDR family oxidoreductase [Kordiimonadaceae bacterium]MDA9770478.1 SDR family oxidoreductase [Emcibacteraceae bacterium]
MNKNTSHKTAVVTGGTSGIGLTLAQGLSNAGYDVIAAGLNPPQSDDEKITFIELDITDKGAVKSLFSDLNQLDILINAAGIIRREAELDPDVFEETINVNLNGTMRACAAARSLLSQSSGSIVNIASMLSYFGGGLVPGYAASKGGIMQLTKSLAIAYAGDNIRVNALAPGWIKTPLTENLQNDDKRSEAILSRTPLGRWGTPEDLVGPALFLIGSDAKFITGSLLNVDGGYAAM